jgi:malate dehydrogenase (oxaloacetate-decarboxylating)
MGSVWRDADGSWRTTLRGRDVLHDPRINKGTGFSEEERQSLGLVGLLPPAHLSLEEQERRVYDQYRSQPTDLAKNVVLTELQDRNEVLFYKLLCDHLTEMLPIVYTPTIGQRIEQFSHEYRRPRGVYLSVDHPELVDESLAALGLGSGDVDLVVATDAEAILGIGDWGVGGIEICVGKLAVYIAAGGIDPNRCVPVMLDVGTNRRSLLEDPDYIGNRHERVGPEEYERFIDIFVDSVEAQFPGALLHWEDLSSANAHRLADRYKDRLPTFNDDMQGTGAVNLAVVLSGIRVSQIPLTEQRIVIFGAGTAGTGIADQLVEAMVVAGAELDDARARIWAVDRHGLVTADHADAPPAARRYARPQTQVGTWARSSDGIGLGEVVARVHPTVLIGTSTVAGAFSEEIVREMASHTERPIVLPLSNPTNLCEATPADMLAWTDGRALVATGSPFDPVRHGEIVHVIGQANNALIFPGLGLGAIACGARRITERMLAAAAHALSDLVDVTHAGAPLLPPVAELRQVSLAVAVAVAREAIGEGVASRDLSDLAETLSALMWQPEYRSVLPGESS